MTCIGWKPGEQRRRGMGDVQIRAAGDDAQRLVGGITAHVRAQIHGVVGLREKFQIRAVGVVHQQQHAQVMARRRDAPEIQHIPQVIRAGHIDRRGPLGAFLQRPAHLLRRDGTADIAAARFRIEPVSAVYHELSAVRLRIEPPDVDIQQGGGVDKGLMGVAGRQNTGPFPF